MNFIKRFTPYLTLQNKILLWFIFVILFLFVMWLLGKFLKKESKSFEKLFKKNRSTFTRGSTESKGEAMCRKICKELFGREFKKIRPKELRNNVTGHNLELDLYNDELKLAVEYNGKQHYDYVPFFHKNKEALMNQKYRDEIKRMLCKNLGIKLIEIPYTVKLEDLESFIRIAALNYGINPDLLPKSKVQTKDSIVDENDEDVEVDSELDDENIVEENDNNEAEQEVEYER